MARGVENGRLALDDRHERIPTIPDLEQHLADLGAALLAVAPERLELRGRQNGAGRRLHVRSVTGGCHRPHRSETAMQWLNKPGHHAWLSRECDRLLDFAEGACRPDGGFAWLDDDGRPRLDRHIELWITSRMTHVFAVAHLLGRPGAGPLADHGVAALEGVLRDREHGGWFSAVGASGPVETDKRAYDHAFVVLAATSAVAAGRDGADDLL